MVRQMVGITRFKIHCKYVSGDEDMRFTVHNIVKKGAKQSVGGFLNNSRIEVFFWPIRKLLVFLNFSHGMYSIYVLEGMCIVRHRKSFIGSGAAHFIHNNGHMIPRNGVLIVSSLPLD